MLEFQEKRKIKRLIYSRTVFVCLIILILLLLNSIFKVYLKQSITKDNLVKTVNNLKSLQAREEVLSSEIDRLKTEGGTEEEIREKYGLVKPGEEVIIMVDEDEVSGSSTISSNSLWQKILDWLK